MIVSIHYMISPHSTISGVNIYYIVSYVKFPTCKIDKSGYFDLLIYRFYVENHMVVVFFNYFEARTILDSFN